MTAAAEPITDEYRFPLHESEVRRFAEASWDSNPAYRYGSDGEQVMVPPTFACCAATLSGRAHSLEALGFDVSRAFHGTETITLTAPLKADTVLTVHESTTRLSAVRGRRGGTMERALRRSDLVDDSGAHLGYTTRVLLEADRVLSAERPGHVTAFDDGLRLRADPVEYSPREASTFRPGETIGEAHFGPLTRTDFVRYAAASGDLTAIHFDEYAARASGYPTTFAMGMLSAAFVGHVLSNWVVLSTPSTLAVRFREQVWPGDTLRITGTVAEQTTHATRVDVSCTVNGIVVTTAQLDLARCV